MVSRSRASRAHRLPRASLAAGIVLLLAQGCGGRSDTEEYLFGVEGPGTAGSRPGTGGVASAGRPSTGGAAGVGAMGGGGGASAGFGATSPSGGVMGVAGTLAIGGTAFGGIGQGGSITGGAASVGGTLTMGGFGPVGGTAPSAGAGGASEEPTISCGAGLCDTGTQTCCAGLGGLQCLDGGAVCQGAVLGCTTNGDCDAGVCCLSFTGDSSAASSCRPACSTMGGTRDRQLCQTDQDCRMPFRYCTPTVFGVSICTRTG
jgi:hypothetical protein